MKKKIIGWTLFFTIGFILVYILASLYSPKAHANMCGPSNLPIVGYMNPYVKGCQLYLPGAGNLPQLPVIQQPVSAPQPVWIPPWGSWARPFPSPLP